MGSRRPAEANDLLNFKVYFCSNFSCLLGAGRCFESSKQRYRKVSPLSASWTARDTWSRDFSIPNTVTYIRVDLLIWYVHLPPPPDPVSYARATPGTLDAFHYSPPKNRRRLMNPPITNSTCVRCWRRGMTQWRRPR